MNQKCQQRYIDAFHRMLPKVKVRENGCWEFTGAISSSGHGNVRVKMPKRAGCVRFKTMGTHVISFWVNKHRTRKHICHECNFKPCINPDHLYAGTRSANMKQMVADGLGKHQFSSTYQPARQNDDCPF